LLFAPRADPGVRLSRTGLVSQVERDRPSSIRHQNPVSCPDQRSGCDGRVDPRHGLNYARRLDRTR